MSHTRKIFGSSFLMFGWRVFFLSDGVSAKMSSMCLLMFSSFIFSNERKLTLKKLSEEEEEEYPVAVQHINWNCHLFQQAVLFGYFYSLFFLLLPAISGFSKPKTKKSKRQTVFEILLLLPKKESSFILIAHLFLPFLFR